MVLCTFCDCAFMVKAAFKMIVFDGATGEFQLSEVQEMAGLVLPAILFCGSKDFFPNHYLLLKFSVVC